MATTKEQTASKPITPAQRYQIERDINRLIDRKAITRGSVFSGRTIERK